MSLDIGQHVGQQPDREQQCTAIKLLGTTPPTYHRTQLRRV
jgi:hypothetical protein